VRHYCANWVSALRPKNHTNGNSSNRLGSEGAVALSARTSESGRRRYQLRNNDAQWKPRWALRSCSYLMDTADAFGIKGVIPDNSRTAATRCMPTIAVHSATRVRSWCARSESRRTSIQGTKKSSCGEPSRQSYRDRVLARPGSSWVLYRRQSWFDALTSPTTCRTQRRASDHNAGGACTVMRFFVGKILELPVTTTRTIRCSKFSTTIRSTCGRSRSI